MMIRYIYIFTKYKICTIRYILNESKYIYIYTFNISYGHLKYDCKYCETTRCKSIYNKNVIIIITSKQIINSSLLKLISFLHQN